MATITIIIISHTYNCVFIRIIITAVQYLIDLMYSRVFSFYSQLSVLFKHNRHVRTEKCKYYPMLKTQIECFLGLFWIHPRFWDYYYYLLFIIMSTYNKLHDDYRLFQNINKVLRVSFNC